MDRLFRPLLGADQETAYGLLKVLTVALASGFLLAARALLRRLGLAAGERAIALLFGGLSVSAWFHFSTPETHAFAFPALALYLVAILAIAEGRGATRANRALLVGSIVVAGLARIDQWRLLPVTALLLALPALRGQRRRVALDLALAGLIGFALATWAVATYVEVPWSDAPRTLVQRTDTRQLAGRLGRLENLEAAKLARIARGIGVYSLLMPLPLADQPDPQRHRAFWEPFSYFLRKPAAAVVLAGVITLVAFSALASLRVAIRGDPFQVAIWLYLVSGWLFYSWFNPWEPFLWLGEFLPFQLALIACALRSRPRSWWTALSVLTAGLAIHNGVYFWTALR